MNQSLDDKDVLAHCAENTIFMHLTLETTELFAITVHTPLKTREALSKLGVRRCRPRSWIRAAVFFVNKDSCFLSRNSVWAALCRLHFQHLCRAETSGFSDDRPAPWRCSPRSDSPWGLWRRSQTAACYECQQTWAPCWRGPVKAPEFHSKSWSLLLHLLIHLNSPTCILSTRSHLFPTRTRGTDAETRWLLHSWNQESNFKNHEHIMCIYIYIWMN